MSTKRIQSANHPSGEGDPGLLAVAGTLVVLVALPALLAMASALARSRPDPAYPESRRDSAPVERAVPTPPPAPSQAGGDSGETTIR